MELLQTTMLLGAGLTGTRFFCSVQWPHISGASLWEEVQILLMLALLWIGGLLALQVVFYMITGGEWIAGFAHWQPFASEALGWINGIQLTGGLLVIALALSAYEIYHDDTAWFQPYTILLASVVYYAVVLFIGGLILWALDAWLR